MVARLTASAAPMRILCSAIALPRLWRDSTWLFAPERRGPTIRLRRGVACRIFAVL